MVSQYRDDGQPVQIGVEALVADLDRDHRQEDRQKDQRSDRVAEIHGHRHCIAAGLAESCGENLDDPEAEHDFGNFAGSRRATVDL
jgi:hypothetical protein